MCGHAYVQCTAPLATAVLAKAPGRQQPIHLRGGKGKKGKGKKYTTA
jgi:hypothetical protein